MTTQQDSVDVERRAREILAAQGDGRFAANILAHGRDDRVSVTASTALNAIIAALSLPITQRDEQGDQLRALSDAATYGQWRTVEHDGSIWIDADDEGDMPVALMMGGSPHNQDRADAAFILAAVAFARAAIRRLSIEQGDQDGEAVAWAHAAADEGPGPYLSEADQRSFEARLGDQDGGAE